ncbi:MAG TPA: hypothetical protein VF137_12440 [Candidatus Dormibacteraeota bacterium]
MSNPRSLLFSVVSALFGMSLVAAGILSIPGVQILPLGQYILGANEPIAVLVLGIGFLVAAIEKIVQPTFVRLAIIYALASIIFQLVAGSQAGHTLVQAIAVPVIAAVLLVVLSPDPKAIIPSTSAAADTAPKPA